MRKIEQVKLLIVEDDEGDFMTIERAFEEARIVNELIRAKDGIEALQILRGTDGRERIRRPYFVLCDINMPRLDGLGLVAELRRDPELEDTIVFILTTSRHDEDRQKAYGLHVAGYIDKRGAGKGFLKLIEMLGSYLQIVNLP